MADIQRDDSGAVASAPPSADQLIESIIAAAADCDLTALATLCQALFENLKTSGDALDHETASRLLKELRNARAFRELALLGDRLIVLGRGEPNVRRLTAQGLVDSGQPAAALDVLETLFKTGPADDKDIIDAHGLQGRARKQIYVDPVDRPAIPRAQRGFANALAHAVQSYETGYQASKNKGDGADVWSYHAINLVACLKRAKFDGVDVTTGLHADALADEIIDALETQGGAKYAWDSASIGEAYLSRGDWDNAGKWLTLYASQSDAFALAGTIRQLEQVWGITAGPDAPGRILFELKSRLLAKNRGQLNLTDNDRLGLLQEAKDPGGPRLEAILSHDRPKPIGWLREGLARANSVAKIATRSGFAMGTGFLVRGGDFIKKLGDQPVLLTNAHVVSDLPDEINNPFQPSLPLNKAVAQFTAVGQEVKHDEFQLKRILARSSRSELDFSLIELHPEVRDIECCQLSDVVPTAHRSRLLIIGHPDGRPLEISLFDMPLLQVGHKTGGNQAFKYLHYTNPTEGGSSGSPIFEEDNWQVVGLHHSGPFKETKVLPKLAEEPGEHPANEGILIQSIREAAEQEATGRTSVSAPARGRTSGQAAESLGQLQGVDRASPAPEARSQAPTAPAPPAAPVPSAPATAARASADTGHLTHDIPAHMVDGTTHQVKARISRQQSAALFDGLRAESRSALHEVPVSPTMTVRLVAPGGGFTIVSITDETQWLDRKDGQLADVTEWRWSVRPEVTGEHELQLVVAARQDSVALPSPPPKRIPVRVRVNVGRRVGGIAKWAVVAVGSGALAVVGQTLLKSQWADPILKLIQ